MRVTFRTTNGGLNKPTLRALPSAPFRSAAGWALGRRVVADGPLAGLGHLGSLAAVLVVPGCGEQLRGTLDYVAAARLGVGGARSAKVSHSSAQTELPLQTARARRCPRRLPEASE